MLAICVTKVLLLLWLNILRIMLASAAVTCINGLNPQGKDSV